MLPEKAADDDGKVLDVDVCMGNLEIRREVQATLTSRCSGLAAKWCREVLTVSAHYIWCLSPSQALGVVFVCNPRLLWCSGPKGRFSSAARRKQLSVPLCYQGKRGDPIASALVAFATQMRCLGHFFALGQCAHGLPHAE